MGNKFGSLFSISTWGESHGGGIGVVIDGCPPRLAITKEEIQYELDRRRPGQSAITTPRQEADLVEIISGVYNGFTLGTPIALYVANKDAQPGAYDEMKNKLRPSHADFTYQKKFGIRNHEGGGRSSARETIGRVAAGAIAKKLLTSKGVIIRAYIESIHQISMLPMDSLPTIEEVEATPVRCPDLNIAEKMIECIKQYRDAGDSVGGVIRCRVQGLPVGLGDPVFDRLEAELAKSMLSLPATKGFEVGSGFSGTQMTGSQHNDLFTNDPSGGIRIKSNRSGGVQGGISNGEELYFRVGFKPTATVIQKIPTVDQHGRDTILQGKGRHDPCVVPRAVPIVEAMTAMVLVDRWMKHKAQCGTFNLDPLTEKF